MARGKVIGFCALLLCLPALRASANPVIGTPVNTLLTNRIFWAGQNLLSGSNSRVTNVYTNAGGEFISAASDRSNGIPSTPSYFTNALRNWGNATDIFILSTRGTNTNSGSRGPWQVWFENLSGSRITNIRIVSGKTNRFRMAVQPSALALVGSFIEYRMVAKSSNSTRSGVNTSIYTGDNRLLYGGPTNKGLGRGSQGPRYVTISSQNPFQDNEFVRLKIMVVSNYYVNNNDLDGDIFCTAVGSDANSGASPASPKATLTNLLATYNIEPGDTIHIDRGIYRWSTKVLINDKGSSAKSVVVKGAGVTNTVINATNLSFGIKLTNVMYIKFQDFSIKNPNYQNLYLDFTTNCVFSNLRLENSKGDGIYSYASDLNRMKYLKIRNSTNQGIRLDFSSDRNTVLCVTQSLARWGLKIATSSSNILAGSQISSNRYSGIFITNASYNCFTNNNIFSNRGEGVASPGCDDQIFYNNRLYNNRLSGISVFTQNGNWGDRNLIKKNRFIRNGNNGIYIFGSRNTIISNTIATNTQNGVFTYGTTNLYLNNWIYSNHSQGIWLEGAQGVVISNNLIALNDQNGIGCPGRSYARILQNRILGNMQCGISMYWGGSFGNDDNFIKQNIMNHNGNDGLYIDGTRNEIISNTFASNRRHGVWQVGGGGVTTNMFNLVFQNSSNGMIIENFNDALTVVRNNSLFKNGRIGLKTVAAFAGSVRNCIAVSNTRGFTNFASQITYSLAKHNTLGNFSQTPGTGCLTNEPYFVSTVPYSADFLRLSGTAPSPAINGGNPSDPVPDGGGSRIDMGCFEYIITPAQISLSKDVNAVRLGGASSTAIPGSSIEYRVHYTNWGGVAENAVVYDQIQTGYLVFVTNSFTNSQPGWTAEFSTNTNPDQSWGSTAYTTNQPAFRLIKWVRWKRNTVGENNAGDLFFRVTIK